MFTIILEATIFGVVRQIDNLSSKKSLRGIYFDPFIDEKSKARDVNYFISIHPADM